MRTRTRLAAIVAPFALASIALAVLISLITAGPAQAACDVPNGTNVTTQSAVNDIGCETINRTAALYIENGAITVSNSAGASATATLLAAADDPITGLVATNDSPTSLGSATTLTATITAGTNVSYAWAFGDGTAGSGPAVSHSYPAAGTYTALVTASNASNTLTAMTNVTVTTKLHFPVIFSGFCVDYADDFNNSATGWPVSDNANETLEYLSGEYRILVKSTSWWSAARSGYKASTFTTTVDVRNGTGIYGTYGLVFGLSDDWQEFYTFEIDPLGKYGIFRLDAAGWSLLTTGSSPILNVGTATNRIQVVRAGATIDVYANGLLLTSITDGTYVGARHVGLIATSYDQPNLDVRFDNFSVDEMACASSIGFKDAVRIPGRVTLEMDLPFSNAASGAVHRKE